MRHLTLWALAVFTVMWIGATGYVLTEHWNWFDAWYMAVITLTTTGFREVHNLDTNGQIWTMVLSVVGIFMIFGTVGVVAETVMQDATSGRREARKMARDIAAMRDHFIVCGYGRVGTHVIRELVRDHQEVVVVDVRADSLQRAMDDGHLCVPGNATSDEVLRKAGVERARCLVTCIDSDADNVYVTLTARALNPKLFIVGRAGDREVVPKLSHAGADRSVSPYTMAGRRMVELALRPGVVEFIDAALSRGDMAFTMEEVPVDDLMAGLSVGMLREKGVFTMAIMHGPGDYEPNPADDRRVKAGEHLIVSGSSETIAGLRG